MNLTELSALLDTGDDVLRVETLGAYDSDSDRDWLHRFLAGGARPDVELKRPWLDRLAGAARTGRPWRRLRVIPDPVTDYFRYACEWSYPDNIEAGEDVRVIDRAVWDGTATVAGDHYLVDDRVAVMHYSPAGRFEHADLLTDPTTVHLARAAARQAWQSHAHPMAEWWADHPQLHRAPPGS